MYSKALILHLRMKHLYSEQTIMKKNNIRDGNFFLTISNIFLFLSITNIYKRYIHKYNLRPRLEANTYTHMLYKQTFLK